MSSLQTKKSPVTSKVPSAEASFIPPLTLPLSERQELDLI
jgi:hypothetical protein